VSPNWNDRCLNSIRKVEIAKRYNIRFGQTEIYCARCGRPCWPGRHTCSDLRLKLLQEKKRENKAAIKAEIQFNYQNALTLIKKLGRTKIATLLEIDVKTVSNWINRRKIPFEYFERILTL